MTSDRKLLIEAMAMAMMNAELGAGTWQRGSYWGAEPERDIWRGRAAAALGAIEARGDVVVPSEPSDDMWTARVPDAGDDHFGPEEWRAMIAASPYRGDAERE